MRDRLVADLQFPDVQPVILAAGHSSRMGSPKPFLGLEDSTFIETICRRISGAGLLPPVIIANPAHCERYAQGRIKACIEYNENVDEGMFRSLRLGIAACKIGIRHAMTCLVDMPLITTETYVRLASESKKHPGKIIVACHGGESGHPVLWPRVLFPVVTNWPGDNGAREIIEQHVDRVVRIGVRDPAVLRDIDTPEDYENIL